MSLKQLRAFLAGSGDVRSRASAARRPIKEAIANGREALRDCIEVSESPGARSPNRGLLPRSCVSVCLNTLFEIDETGRE